MADEQFPSGPGGRSYHKIERYRQGVPFSCATYRTRACACHIRAHATHTCMHACMQHRYRCATFVCLPWPPICTSICACPYAHVTYACTLPCVHVHEMYMHAYMMHTGVRFSFVTSGHVLRLAARELVLQLVIAMGLLTIARMLTQWLGFLLLTDRQTRRMLRYKVTLTPPQHPQAISRTACGSKRTVNR